MTNEQTRAVGPTKAYLAADAELPDWSLKTGHRIASVDPFGEGYLRVLMVPIEEGFEDNHIVRLSGARAALFDRAWQIACDEEAALVAQGLGMDFSGQAG